MDLIKKILKKIYKKVKVPVYIEEKNDKIFVGKTAVIIGGTGGIGFSIAENLYNSGCNVILCGLNQRKLDDCKNKLSGIKTIKFDLNNFSKYDDFVLECNQNNTIDFVIISSGVHIENPSFFEMKMCDFDKVISLDFKSTYFLCQKFSKYMIKLQKKGKIILISSSRGCEPAWTPYGISKNGINAMTKGLAKELIKYNIILNTISPGPTATSLINYSDGDDISSNENAFNRLIMPKEIGTLVNFLLRKSSDMICGENILISGGRGTFDIR